MTMSTASDSVPSLHTLGALGSRCGIVPPVVSIELRRVAYNKRLSEETPCFTADVWVNGERVGDVRNHGHGGSDIVYPPALGAFLDAYAKTLPRPANQEYPECGETVIGRALERALARQDLARKLRTRTVFASQSVLYTTKATPAQIRINYPGAQVLNEMPPEEALTLYLRLTAGDPPPKAEPSPVRTSRAARGRPRRSPAKRGGAL